jgi:hypothetical protein
MVTGFQVIRVLHGLRLRAEQISCSYLQVRLLAKTELAAGELLDV